MKKFIFFSTLPMLIVFVDCLQCPYECLLELCPGLDESTCANGIAKDNCDCCPVCASGEGEVCGGIFHGPNKCMPGTKCIVEVDFGLPFPLYIQKTGTCKKSMKVYSNLSYSCGIYFSV